MDPLSAEQLISISSARGIEYNAIADDNPLVVRSSLSKVFPVSAEAAFQRFADPTEHVALFPIIAQTTPPIREGVHDFLPENMFYVIEHVQEANLPPRLMLAKYTLQPPFTIIKEMVTDPFSNPGDVESDKKRGALTFRFDPTGDAESRLTIESMFHAETGAIFARGFIDRVWLNFFERMMMEHGQLSQDQFLT